MSIKILMAGCDHAVLEMARASVSSLTWCDLTTVKDGREAAKYLRDQKFDGVVFADRILHIDAFELMQQLKHSSLNAGIPVVMLTREDDIDSMRRGFKAGATFIAVRPPNRERFYHLFRAIRGAMESERRRHLRLPYRTPATCRFVEPDRNQFVGESMELSVGGMSVRPSGGAELGEIVELEFLFPQASRPAQDETPKSRQAMFAEGETPLSGPQKVQAKVCYVAPNGEAMGLVFQGLTSAQREVIQHYIGGDD